MSEITDDFLEHHGVVGMKWGKRSGGKSGSSGGKSPINKAHLKVVRKDIYKDALNRGAGNKKKKGALAAATILTQGMALSPIVGYNLSRSAGHSKGKSLVIGYLAGAPGGMIAAELSARKAVRETD